MHCSISHGRGGQVAATLGWAGGSQPGHGHGVHTTLPGRIAPDGDNQKLADELAPDVTIAEELQCRHCGI